MKKVLFYSITVMLFFSFKKVYSQGCVAIRSNGIACTMAHPDEEDNKKYWQLNIGYRYFKSYKHFKGTDEQKQRQVAHNEVINYSNTVDLTLFRQLNRRWSVGISLPLVYTDRSSLYEHGGERHTSTSYGIGDLRLIASRWILNPSSSKKGNFQIGLGVKLPTGNYNYMAKFYNVGPDKTSEYRPVDQSIQPGDGGLGIITELNGYFNLSKKLSAYTNLFYLLNPRETNGTRTYRETLSATLANESIMSVPDQYMARVGLNYRFGGLLKNLSLLGGGRLEGIPVYDLIGGSGGFRRPGYVISIEPGVNYFINKLTVFATAPIALVRNRTQSVTDKENSILQNKFVNGDAAFADYSINFGVTYRFNK